RRAAPTAKGWGTRCAFGGAVAVSWLLFLQPSSAIALDAVDFGEHGIDVFFLLEEPRATIGKQREKFGDLRAFVARNLVQVEQLSDLRQGEPEALSAQDQFDPHALALAVNAGAPVATRRDEPAVFVEAYRARRQRKFSREIRN